MSKVYGVKETKELVGFGLGLGNAVGTALADGKLELSEASLLLPVLLKTPEAFGGIAQIGQELGELDEQEKAELKSFVESEFNIPQDNIEAAIETALKLALDLYGVVKLFTAPKPA
jgi:hypothetical protein